MKQSLLSTTTCNWLFILCFGKLTFLAETNKIKPTYDMKKLILRGLEVEDLKEEDMPMI